MALNGYICLKLALKGHLKEKNHLKIAPKDVEGTKIVDCWQFCWLFCYFKMFLTFYRLLLAKLALYGAFKPIVRRF